MTETKSWEWVLQLTTEYTELVKSDILTSYFSKIIYKIVKKQKQKLKNLKPL
jgi:hypothetical protein